MRPDVLLGVLPGEKVDSGNPPQDETAKRDTSHGPVTRNMGYAVVDQLGARTYIETATDNKTAQDLTWRIIIGHATAQGLERRRTTT